MNNEHLKSQIEKQARRMKQAEHDQPTLIAQTVFLGTLGLILVLPIVVGAYLGHWGSASQYVAPFENSNAHMPS